MAKPIQKLNKLNNPESFIQINTVKGFKYIDRAGEIVNLYHKKDVPPQFSMGLDGLIIKEPIDKVNELKITSETFWMKFLEIDSLDMISSIFTKEAEKNLKILEVEKGNRIGWRNYFIYEFKSEEEQKNYLKKFIIIEKTKPSLVRLEINTEKEFNANLVIQPVVKNDSEKTKGILFDIDLFKHGDIKIEDISKTLKNFREYLNDENGFLGLINNTFE